MAWRKWDELPESMKKPEVKKYYKMLEKKKTSLFFKRLFDIFVSAILLVLLSPVFIVLIAAIKLTSKGPAEEQKKICLGCPASAACPMNGKGGCER